MQDIDLTQSLYKYDQKEQKNEFLDKDLFQYQCCPYCERNFFIGKLKYHLKLCNVNSPMIKSPLKKIKRTYIMTLKQKQKQQKVSQLQRNIPQNQHQKIQQNQQDYNRQINSPLLLNIKGNNIRVKLLQSPEQNRFKKCVNCDGRFGLSMIQKHVKNCNLRLVNQNLSYQDQQLLNGKYKKKYLNPQIVQIKSNTKIDFNKNNIKNNNKRQKDQKLPRIRNSARQKKITQKKYISTDLKQLGQYTVKIRQQLSCFKKALQVQKISCPYCNRKFSNQASLRHIPICQKLKNQQKHSIVFKKHSKSEVYKLNLPLKKSIIGLRPNYMSSMSKEYQNKEKQILKPIKTTRITKKNPLLLIEGNNGLEKFDKQKQKLSKNLLAIQKIQRQQEKAIQLKQQEQKAIQFKQQEQKAIELKQQEQKAIELKQQESKSIELQQQEQNIELFQHNSYQYSQKQVQNTERIINIIDPMNMTFSKDFIHKQNQAQIQKNNQIDYEQNFDESSNAINEFLNVKIE